MYLYTKDYSRIIQTSELNAITTNDISVRQSMELSVAGEIRAMLIQKYDLSQEFQDTSPFSMAVIYKATNRVYLDASTYDPTAGTYTVNSLTLQAGSVYVNTTAVVIPEVFNPSKSPNATKKPLALWAMSA